MQSAGAPIDVAIIGGGAAGLATAIFTRRRLPDRRVAVLDGATKLGAKILVSGGGRCNVTNRIVTPEDFWGGSSNIIKRVLSALPVDRTLAFFSELGVELHEEPNGKLFPDSNSAKTVVEAMLREAARLDVRLLTAHRVTGIRRDSVGFLLDVHVSPSAAEDEPGDVTRRAACVVLATGGRSLPKTGSDGAGYALAESLGHSLVPTTPALAPLLLDGAMHAKLSGISQEVELTVRATGEKPIHLCGEMLWTHFGLSGPVVLNASRHWHRAREEGRDARVTLNFLPGADFAKADAMLIALA
ncbi:MAG TPA: aminoacetone oxidase family FAD-binding enzyme, partial [Phycisphaerae bacterium]|nr:aminoacetone oxidase family FAD-binding enzyme [Phycisphaerae bacterium]